MRLQMQSNIQITGVAILDHVPFTSQPQSLAIIRTRRHMNLQLLPCRLNSVPLAKSARFLDHAPGSTASWAWGYLDELCKSAALDASHLTVPSTFPAWLPSTPCCCPCSFTF